jgi:hypothetical protein
MAKDKIVFTDEGMLLVGQLRLDDTAKKINSAIQTMKTIKDKEISVSLTFQELQTLRRLLVQEDLAMELMFNSLNERIELKKGE